IILLYGRRFEALTGFEGFWNVLKIGGAMISMVWALISMDRFPRVSHRNHIDIISRNHHRNHIEIISFPIKSFHSPSRIKDGGWRIEDGEWNTTRRTVCEVNTHGGVKVWVFAGGRVSK